MCSRLLRDSERPCGPQVRISCGRYAYARRQHHGGLYDSVLAPLPRPQVSQHDGYLKMRPMGHLPRWLVPCNAEARDVDCTGVGLVGGAVLPYVLQYSLAIDLKYDDIMLVN